MQVSIAMDPSSAPPWTSTAASEPTSRLSPIPSTQAQPSTQSQLSPGQKRSAHEIDTPTTHVPSGHSDSPSTRNQPETFADNKENRDNSLSLKGGEYTATMAQAVPVPMHANSGTEDSQPQARNGGAGSPSATKKRKLSPASREAKQQEKEAKERQRLEDKARKEEEKAKKEEEKAKREEEKRKRDAEKEEERKKREEKKKAKDEEKAAREEEKRKKDEEKLKKERAQTKLNSFFAKPKGAKDQSLSTVSGSPKKPLDGESADLSEKTAKFSEYKRAFPDFFLHPNTYLAPSHRFERDSEALTHLRTRVDSSFNTGSAEQLAFRPSELFKLMPYKRRRGYQNMSVRDILLQMQSLNDMPETSEAARKLKESLKQVRMKSLKFGEDVRPPYQGTYTKKLPIETASKLMRNPFRRALPEVNYDYDSEAEWEDAEEGEELDSEEEEEGSEEGDEDMDGFLDDEDDHLANGKRRLLVGDLEPVCTGIRWQDQGTDPELQTYKLETILPSVTFPIDPFSTSYWQKPKIPEPGQTNGLGHRSTLHSFMGNPAPQSSGPLATQDGNMGAAGKSKRAFPVEQLAEFKTVVEGSDLTKMGLIEILKKRFPKVSKGTLKDTLDSVATRVGQKEADKKWVCK
ncbi:chromatin assembly factor 1 subunit A-domain-containing protein [Aspergillus aurantiobrunneus]